MAVRYFESLASGLKVLHQLQLFMIDELQAKALAKPCKSLGRQLLQQQQLVQVVVAIDRSVLSIYLVLEY